MTLAEIIAANVQYMRNVTVSVDTRYETVEISDDSGAQEEIFLQGQDAHEFIRESEDIWNQVGSVSIADVHLHMARCYVDNLWN